MLKIVKPSKNEFTKHIAARSFPLATSRFPGVSDTADTAHETRCLKKETAYKTSLNLPSL